MSNAMFNVVVCTWTLCSIPCVKQAIAQVYRVLKPGGKFLFIEHGLSQDPPSIQVWQSRLAPIQKVVADGCHLSRKINELVQQQFSNVTIKQFYAAKPLKIIGYMHQGEAI